ncbi:MAG: menaquinone biosynthesis protein [Armatimonadetes bacterium]|nr:menaquinone biosynthesis protein [Armatimonadota bacterium]
MGGKRPHSSEHASTRSKGSPNLSGASSSQRPHDPTTQRPLSIGAPFFNARPLVWPFIEAPSPDLMLIEEVPTRLARRVRNGELDAALISSVEAYRDDALEALPGIGVASRGAVWSIKLFHKLPLDRVRSVALDTSSYTSAALTRILLAERYGNTPEFVNLPPDLDRMLSTCDAALLIGDPGLRAEREGVPYLDLGEAWYEWQGLPFVYAVWAGRPGVFAEGLGDRLHAALERGLTRIDAIVEAEARQRDLDPDVCREYLRNIIRYRLGPEEEQGLRLFLKRAAAYGIIKPK